MIKVKNLHKAFGKQVVLNNINLEVQEGEILVVLGQSGSGKTVLLKILMGLIAPDHGTIEINSQDITKLNEEKLLKIRKNIGYLFQEGALYDFMTVYENIAFPLKEHTRLSNKQIKEKVQHTLKIVDLEGVENKFPSELSGGMRKRVGLARAIILDSKTIFCDEPTSGLDPIRSRDISDLIKNVSKQLTTTTVITSHDIKNSFRIADRLILLHQGEIVSEGTKAQLENSKNQFIHEFIR